MKAKW